MINKYFKFNRLVVFACVFGLLNLMVGRVAVAITNDGYQGTSISGRPSVAIVDAPGGTKVNTFLGTMFLPRTDLRIPGRGLPIEIELTYNSNRAALNSPFGHGWYFKYHIAAIGMPNGDIHITWGDGRTDLFEKVGSNYTPVNEGVFVTLEEFQPNKLRLTSEQQIQYFMDKPAASQVKFMKKMQDPNGNALTFTYGSASMLTQITDASGRSISLGYSGTRVTTITDNNASPPRTLKYTYGNGNQLSFTDPLNNKTTYAYDSGHRMTKATDPLGITKITYSGANFTVASISRSTPTNTVLSTRAFLYDTASKTTTVKDTINGTTTADTKYQYDANNRLVKTTDPLGHFETRTYDAQGNIASVTDANGNTTQYTYDSRGNILTTTDALGHTTTFTYDPVFNKLTSVTDANSHTTTFSYDSQGNLETLQDALGNITEYTYDGFGQLISRENARGFATTFTYNSFGNRTSITDPLIQTTAFTYDNVGNALTKTDANAQTTTYSYDARNRRTMIAYPDATQATYTYDPNDNLLSADDPDTQLDFVYDANSRLVKVTDSELSKVISYQYDGVGNRVQMIGPESAAIAYTYDLASRLDTIVREGHQFNYDYDNGNRLIKLTLPNGAFTDHSYDAANHLLSLINRKSDSSIISSFVYQYDDAGNRTQLTLAGGQQIDYTYDNQDQLTREVRTGGALNYDHLFSYDAVGNRIQQDADGVITTYGYNAADQLTLETTGANVTTYQYDGNGNQIEKISGGDTFNYSYDSRDLLTGFSSSSTTASYAYDALNRRINKSVGGTVTQFLYDNFDAVAEYDGSNSLQAEYLCGRGVDQNLGKFVGANSFYFIRDGLNSTRNILNSTQTVVNSYDYDAWGRILAQVENVANDYTFTGREADDESELYYYRARMYDPSNGRFLQVDPIDDNSGRSYYVYVSNNPTNFMDPMGQWGWLPVVIIVIIILIWPTALGDGELPPNPPTPPQPPPPDPEPKPKPKPPFRINPELRLGCNGCNGRDAGLFSGSLA